MMLIVHGLVMHFNKNAFQQFSFDMLRWCLSGIAALVNIIAHICGYNNEIYDLLTLIFVITIETIVWLISRVYFRKYFVYPVDLELLQDRLGMWVMIVVR